MAKDPAFLFYSGDFTTGTQFMTDKQVGIYIRLLCAQHQHGHLSDKQVKIICPSYDEIVMEKFIIDCNGKYYNKRLEEESEKRKNYSESRSKNRRKGLKNKKKKVVGICLSYDDHMENENENKDSIIIDSKKTWKNDFDTYLQYARDGWKECVNDIEWIERQKSYHPRLNIIKTIESCFVNYWATSEGWGNKKGKRIKDINWKTTIANSLKMHAVYKTNE